MKNAVRSDQDFSEPYKADATAGPPSYPSSRRRVEDPVPDANDMRHQAMEREMTGSLGARLPHDIVSEMEAELKQQVDRLVAERH
ncbi:hypothetical protein [Bradyrhizobium quebecense]|uniref:Uncharacterized protein n=2 Tax=Bradyrhizobium quebecense TaxID=2748629 RepID=A0ACD3V0R9_9BRAD|nr:hypothetical protein [Bradyrhizobium quebecense]UGX99970.1 hypothetical protein J4P68_0021865 [Bradyrhizobium quebecense]